MFMSVCIFALMVCASALSFLDGKICAIQEPSIIIIRCLHNEQSHMFTSPEKLCKRTKVIFPDH